MIESILIICAIGYVVANYLWARSVETRMDILSNNHDTLHGKIHSLEKEVKKINDFKDGIDDCKSRSDIMFCQQQAQWSFNKYVKKELGKLQGVIQSWQELNKSISEHTTKAKKAKKK